MPLSPHEACMRLPHCPRCNYPCNGPHGQPYLGYYTPGEPCDGCGHVEVRPPPAPNARDFAVSGEIDVPGTVWRRRKG